MIRHSFFLLAVLFFFGISAPDSSIQAPIRVEGGLVAGVQLPNSEVISYKGIPYAAPPVGELRWKPPQPVVPWEGLKQAYEFSDACIQELQRSRLPWSEEFMHLGDANEDCLYLNVWTPETSPEASLPVMVYLHGGGLNEGSSAIAVYDGEELAKKGVVLVSINYRVAALGFMAHPELTKESEHGSSGNYGLLDQLAALKWVQANIAAFGGDPNNVTIFGQSAGARSSSMHVKSPLSQGLFARAILLSGTQRREPLPHSNVISHAEAEKIGLEIQRRLGVNSLEEMRQIPAERFIEPDIPRTNAIEDGWFMPANPQIDREVPVMTGFTGNDQFINETNVFTVDAYTEDAKKDCGKHAEAFLSLYTPDAFSNVKALTLQSQRDKAFVSISICSIWARTQQEKSDVVYTYYFDRAIPWPEYPIYGAFHTGEIPYVFKTLNVLDRAWEPVDYRVADEVSSYWVNFAKTGDPNGEGLARWDPFKASENATMRLGEKSGKIHFADSERMEFWRMYFKDTTLK